MKLTSPSQPLHSDRNNAVTQNIACRLAAARSLRTKKILAALAPCALLLCLAVEGKAQIYSILHSFAGEDGAWPEARLMVSGSMLYGTTCGGGISNAGTVFQLRTDGNGFAVMHHFTSFPDGAHPQAGLVLAGSTLYGTTCGGGISNYLCVAPSAKEGAPCGGGKVEGGGTVFKINVDSTDYFVLHQFAGPNFPMGTRDGLSPQAGLCVSGSAIYGTTYQGGQGYCPGAVFALQTDVSAFAVLKGFTDAWFPAGGLTLSGSTLYGTSCSGPDLPPALLNAGTVFRMNTDGNDFTVLKAFLGTSDGAAPYGDLLLEGPRLYGTTSGDGQGNVGNGTVFKLDVDGNGYTVLKNFTLTDGASPRAGLVLAGNALFGTTSRGGSFGQGTVFKVNTDGTDFAVLKSFSGGSDGANPYGELVLSGTTLCGTAAAGGASGKGVVFSISLAPSLLAPPMSQTAEVGTSFCFKANGTGAPPLTYLWFFNSTNLLTASSDCLLQITNAQDSQAGAYSVVITNAFGAITSAPVLLSVIPPVPRHPVAGLRLSGQAGIELKLEDSTSLSPAPNWSIFDHVMLETNFQWYFDLSALTPQRFYRASQTAAPGIVPSLGLHIVPAITLTGNAGDRLRVDYINRLGPVDAWVPLDTVTLTNTQQIYIDVTAPGQPERVYRLVNVP